MNEPNPGLNTKNLKRKDVCALLNISDWTLMMMEKDSSFPRIEYNRKVIRYDLADILHYRESKKCGGWLPKKAA